MLKQSKTEYRATSSEGCAEGTGNASGSFQNQIQKNSLAWLQACTLDDKEMGPKPMKLSQTKGHAQLLFRLLGKPDLPQTSRAVSSVLCNFYKSHRECSPVVKKKGNMGYLFQTYRGSLPTG